MRETGRVSDFDWLTIGRSRFDDRQHHRDHIDGYEGLNNTSKLLIHRYELTLSTRSLDASRVLLEFGAAAGYLRSNSAV